MRFRKRKKENAQQESVAQAPREIGLNGAVGDLYLADKAAKEDLAVKEAAFKKTKEKYDRRDVFYNKRKYLADRDAYEAAAKVPYQIHRGLYEGAVEAFLDKRHENLQEIISCPEAFLQSKDQSAGNLVTGMLISLISEVPTPETLLLALANVDEEKRRDILDRTLWALVWGYNNIEETASVLLKAGARADYNSSGILAAAIHKGQPVAVIDMLLDNGAKFDEAIATMRAKALLYGDSADRLEFLQYKKETQATIAQLKATIDELTTRLENKGEAPVAVPAPVPEKTAVRLRIAAV